MKGVHVLLRAAKLLGNRGGWSLSAYGAASYRGAEGAGLEDLPVSLLPAFAPEQLEKILSETDVLLVPSVMRETYSLLTREALSAGVPVICTDSLGPEEVVRHRRNGLVVPAADAEALAGAVGELLERPPLLDQLRSGCASTPVRSVREQADSLLARFEELRSSPDLRGSSQPTPSISRVLFAAGIDGAPLRYRARLPAEALSLLGVESDVRHYRDPEVWDLACRADAVVLYRVPATVQILDLAASVRALGIPLIFDVDDIIFDPGIAKEIPALAILPAEEAALWMEGVRRYRTTMEACD
ncbi:MAG: glycosyltransferase, partial [Thermoplasmata archaeon]